MVLLSPKGTTGNEPVVMSGAPEIAASDDGRQADPLQSATLVVHPINISPGDSTANTFGGSPNTNPTDITQPLIATEGATDPECTKLVFEPAVLFYIVYPGITEREHHKSIRTCSFEVSLETICHLQHDDAPLRFQPHWRRFLVDSLIKAVAKNLLPGVMETVLGPFESACDTLRSENFARRLRFSKFRGDPSSAGGVLLDWLTVLALQPCTMHVAVHVDLYGITALLQGDSIIPFVAEDRVMADREEVLGDGTLQTAVQQHGLCRCHGNHQ